MPPPTDHWHIWVPMSPAHRTAIKKLCIEKNVSIGAATQQALEEWYKREVKHSKNGNL